METNGLATRTTALHRCIQSLMQKYSNHLKHNRPDGNVACAAYSCAYTHELMLVCLCDHRWDADTLGFHTLHPALHSVTVPDARYRCLALGSSLETSDVCHLFGIIRFTYTWKGHETLLTDAHLGRDYRESPSSILDCVCVRGWYRNQFSSPSLPWSTELIYSVPITRQTVKLTSTPRDYRGSPVKNRHPWVCVCVWRGGATSLTARKFQSRITWLGSKDRMFFFVREPTLQ